MSSFTSIRSFIRETSETFTIGEQIHKRYHLTTLYLAHLAYFNEDHIRASLAELEVRRFKMYNRKGTQGYFAEFDDLVVIAFRGTQQEEKRDWKISFDFLRRKFFGVMVHSGYAKAIIGLRDEIEKDLEGTDGKRLIYVGHSMGGALATLLALAHKPTDICTFGSPRLASGKQVRKLLEGINYQRVVSKYDPVRLVPLRIPLIQDYQHYGLRRVVDCDWDWKDWKKPHLLSTYLTALLKEDTPQN
jgi:pimeloyl-ACP methyl ester carboxylesterase